MVSTKTPFRTKAKPFPRTGMKKRNPMPKTLEPLSHPQQGKDLATYQQLLLNPIMDGQGGNDSGVAPSFASVAATFNFQHHVGADTALELDVLKTILIREGYISRMRDCVEGILRGEAPELRLSDGSGILDLLINIREASVEVVDTILTWRDGFVLSPRLANSMRPGSSLRPGTASRAMTPSGFQGAGNALADATSGLPPAFLYQGMNYLLKMTHDLDFLAGIKPLVDAFKVPSEKMKRNPFMTPFTLDDVLDSDSVDGQVEEKHRRLLDAAQVIVEEEIVEVERAAMVQEQLDMPSFLQAGQSSDNNNNRNALPMGLQRSSSSPFQQPSSGELNRNQLSSSGGTGQPGAVGSPLANSMFTPGNLDKHQKLMTWYEEACDQLYRLQYTSDPGFSTSYINQQNSGLAENSTMLPPSMDYPEDIHDEKPQSSFPVSRGQRPPQTVPFRDPIGLFSGTPNAQGTMEIPSAPDPLNPGYTLPYSMSVPNMGMMSTAFQSPVAPGAFIRAKSNQQSAVSSAVDPYSSRAVPIPGHAPPSGISWEDKRTRIFQKQKDRESRMAEHSKNWSKGKAGIMHKAGSAWMGESTRDDPFGRNLDAGYVEGMVGSPFPESGKEKKKKKKKKIKSEADFGPDTVWEAVNEFVQNLSVDELQDLLDMEEPEKATSLIAAATIILLTPASDMPENVTFNNFKTLMLSAEDGIESFVNMILDFDPPEFPQFKVRALKPFLQNKQAHPIALGEISPGIQRLSLWVLQILQPYDDFREYADSTMREWYEHTYGLPKKVKKKKKIKKKAKPPPPQILYKQIQKLQNGEEYYVCVTESNSSIREEPSTFSVKLFNSKSKPFEREIPSDLVTEMTKDQLGIMWVEAELVPRLKVVTEDNGISTIDFKAKKPVKPKRKYIPPGSKRASRSPSPETSISEMPGGRSYQKGLQKKGLLTEKTATKQEKQAVVKIQNQGRQFLAKKRVQGIRETRQEQSALEAQDAATIALQSNQSNSEDQYTADGFDALTVDETINQTESEQDDAATKIQCMARRRQAKARVDQLKKEKAAVKIQTQARRKQANAVVAQKRQERDAAVKIQSKIRQVEAKARVQAIKKERGQELQQLPSQSNTVAESYGMSEDYTAYDASEYTDEFDNMTAATLATKEQLLLEQEQAATKIQSVARGRQARQTVQVKREQNQAAVKIQGVARQRQARHKVAQIKKENDAAVQIQGAIRQRQARKRVSDTRQHQAAVKIQGSVRQRQARKRVEKLRQVKEEGEASNEEDASSAYEGEYEYDEDEDYEDDDLSHATPIAGNDDKTDTQGKKEAEVKDQQESKDQDAVLSKDPAVETQAKEPKDPTDLETDHGKGLNTRIKEPPNNESLPTDIAEKKQEEEQKEKHGSLEKAVEPQDEEQPDSDEDSYGDEYSLSEDEEDDDMEAPQPDDSEVKTQKASELPVESKESEKEEVVGLTPEEAALRIQCAQRRKQANKVVHQKKTERDAAIKIQCKSRQFKAQKVVAEKRDEKWRNEHYKGEVIHMGKVYHIYTDDGGKPYYFNPEQHKRKQSLIRSQKSMDEERQEMLQALPEEGENGEYKAIDDFEDVQELLQDDPTNDEHVAATKIQSIARKNIAKERVEKLKDGAPENAQSEEEEEDEDDYADDDDYDEEFSDGEEEEEQSGTEDNNGPSGDGKEEPAPTDQTLAQREDAAAITIQSKGRQYLAKKRVDKLKEETQENEQKSLNTEESEEEQDDNNYEYDDDYDDDEDFDDDA